jgi:hypothetical protein
MQIQETFKLMPSEILDSPQLNQPSDEFCQDISSLLLPQSPNKDALEASPELQLFNENSYTEEMAIKPVPVTQEEDLSDWRESESDSSIFSPNKLLDCFVVHGRDDRRHKFEDLETQLKQELESLQTVPPCLVERLRQLRMAREANMKRN